MSLHESALSNCLIKNILTRLDLFQISTIDWCLGHYGNGSTEVIWLDYIEAIHKFHQHNVTSAFSEVLIHVFCTNRVQFLLTLKAWLMRISLGGGDDQTPLAWARATFSWLLLLMRKNFASRKMYCNLELCSREGERCRVRPDQSTRDTRQTNQWQSFAFGDVQQFVYLNRTLQTA